MLTSSEVILNGRFLGTHVHALSESGHTSTERERSPNTGAPNIQHAVDLWREPRLCTATTRAVSVSRSKIPGAARMATRAHVALPPGGAAHPSSRASAQRRHFPAMNSVCTSATGSIPLSRYPADPHAALQARPTAPIVRKAARIHRSRENADLMLNAAAPAMMPTAGGAWAWLLLAVSCSGAGALPADSLYAGADDAR